jgi:DNA-binding transcriptional ArsR family regulator
MPPSEDSYKLEDPRALRALAHPLRGRLLVSLRVDGPATASMLGRRLDESSGATSYHLRILARHGFVEDDPGHGGGRERWWRASNPTTSWSPATFAEGDPGDREAVRQFLRRVQGDYGRMVERWIAELERWPVAWQSAALASDMFLRLTAGQLAELTRELEEVVTRYAAAGPDGADAERVVVLLHAFPQRGPLP